MPINSVLYIGESFAEVGLIANGSLISSRRIHLAREPLLKGLTQFFTENNQQPIGELLFSSKSAQNTLRRRHGTAPAFLVTAGFENWLGLSRPIRQAHFTVKADRAQTLVDADMIFGLSERTAPDGRVEKPVESADLEFLVAKLKLHKVEEVAVGLLHAGANSANEQLVGRFLRDQGFRVQLSSDVSKNEYEIARWWAAITNAYLGGDWKTLLADIKGALQAGGHETARVQLVGSNQVMDAEADQAPLSSLFGPMLVMNKWRQNRGHQTLFYFGIEDFWFFDGRWDDRTQWRAEFGPIGISHCGFERCDVQTTQVVQKTFWGIPGLTKTEGGFEPGPMAFGKSVQPQYVDILWALGRINGVDGLSERFNDRARPRIDEALMAMARSRGDHSPPSPRYLAEYIEQEAAARIAAQVPLASSSVMMCGPLAASLRPSLEPLLNAAGIKSNWDEGSDALLAGTAALLPAEGGAV